MNFKYNNGAAYLSEQDWLEVCALLDPYYSQLKDMAQKLNFGMRTSKIWPTYEFTKSSLCSYKIMRFGLNPNYLTDGKVTFHCFFYKYKRNFFKKSNTVISHEIFFVLSSDEMLNINLNLKIIFEAAFKVKAA